MATPKLPTSSLVPRNTRTGGCFDDGGRRHRLQCGSPGNFCGARVERDRMQPVATPNGAWRLAGGYLRLHCKRRGQRWHSQGGAPREDNDGGRWHGGAKGCGQADREGRNRQEAQTSADGPIGFARLVWSGAIHIGEPMAAHRAAPVLSGRLGAKFTERAAAQAAVRRPGAGRKPLSETDPTLATDLESLIDPVTRGDPSRCAGCARARRNSPKL